LSSFVFKMNTAIKPNETSASPWLLLVVMVLSLFSFMGYSAGGAAKIHRTILTEVQFKAKKSSKRFTALKGFSLSRNHCLFLSFFRASSFFAQLKQYNASITNAAKNLYAELLFFIPPNRFLTQHFAPRSSVEGAFISLQG
jgi:hypothetical protein